MSLDPEYVVAATIRLQPPILTDSEDADSHDRESEGDREDDEQDDEKDDENEDENDGGEHEVSGAAHMYNAEEINDIVFEELHLHPDQVRAAQSAWSSFLRASETTDAAGDAMCAAIFEASPTLQTLFKTPRAVFAMKLVGAMSALLHSLGDPGALKRLVETLAFQHLQMEVTTPRVAIIRDALADLLVSELGQAYSDMGISGFRTLLGYVGGAMIYVRNTYADRFRLIATSWAEANKRRQGSHEPGADGESGETPTASTSGSSPSSGKSKARSTSKSDVQGGKSDTKTGKSAAKRGKPEAGLAKARSGVSGSSAENTPRANASGKQAKRGNDRKVEVPTTFLEMFRFNAAVMGFGLPPWMNEVLMVFDTIVCNVANSARLHEECDVLVLKMSKYRGPFRLHDFQTIMLASLRSLVPETWSSEHEVSWIWFWDNVQRLLKAQIDKPAKFGRELTKMFDAFDERESSAFRHNIFETFLAMAPAGQEYFRQSTTRINFIMDKIVSMTAELYKQPEEVVFRLGALGLRHVGYGVPSELFAPFVSAAVEVAGQVAPRSEGLEAFRWSLNLISRILVRVVSEGSTIVMRAINANSAKQLRQAVACAPRCDRPRWVLSVTVGSESISPLMWAIEQGNLEAADAILRDLLTIRADRDRYYFGVDALFARHPDIVCRLCAAAPMLLWTLFDGLVWRSGEVRDAKRRAAYFCKHLLVRQDGGHAAVLKDICQLEDPKLVCHPVIAQVTDVVWARIAMASFLCRNLVMIITIVLYTLSQAVLDTGSHDGSAADSSGIAQDAGMATRISILVCRVWVYFIFLPSHSASHIRLARYEIRTGHMKSLRCIRVPAHLGKHIHCYALIVILCAMIVFEPVFYCIGHGSVLTQQCDSGAAIIPVYTIPSMFGALNLYVLASDLCVFSLRIAAYILVFKRLASEVVLFLSGFAVLLVGFATAASTLKSRLHGFESLPDSAATLADIYTGTAHDENLEALAVHPMLRPVVMAFYGCTMLYLSNLLVAQLASAYTTTFKDMIGLSRLLRGSKVVEEMELTSRARWDRFVRSLELDIPVRFCEGDNGMPGAIEVMELASASADNIENISRFGGTTAPDAVWPEEEKSARTDNTEDRLERIEALIRKLAKKQNQPQKRRGRGHGSGASVMSSCMEGSGSSHGSHED